MKSVHLGLDFDNTIVNYDKIFHKVAVEKSLIPSDVAVSKNAIKDFLLKSNKEDIWTEMQGYVYGLRMLEAEPFLNIINALKDVKRKGFTISIVSHKTQYPYIGKRYNLHKPASEWIEKNLGKSGENLICSQNVFFEKTKKEKIQRIKEIKCDVYIDDLTEILLSPDFPKNTKRVLFDPNEYHLPSTEFITLKDWEKLSDVLGAIC